MSELRWERSSACRHSEAACQPMGILFRWLAVFLSVERQPQGAGSMYSMRHGVPTVHTCFPDCVGAADPVYFARSPGTLGRVIRLAVRVWRITSAHRSN